MVAALLGVVGCGGGGGGGSASATSGSGPEVVLRCLSSHHLDAALSPKGKQVNLASLHEIRISLGQKGNPGDGFVEFFKTPRFARSAAEAMTEAVHLTAGAHGPVQYEYTKETPASTGRIISACAASGA